MFYPLLAIAVGSSVGAWIRWFLGLKLNAIYPNIPLGTVAVNLIGGFIIGFAIAFFAQSQLSPNLKLLIVTGFCGGLTTFSTFSFEVMSLLQEGKLALSGLTIAIHVIGAVAFTIMGMALYQWLSAQ